MLITSQRMLVNDWYIIFFVKFEIVWAYFTFRKCPLHKRNSAPNFLSLVLPLVVAYVFNLKLGKILLKKYFDVFIN